MKSGGHVRNLCPWYTYLSQRRAVSRDDWLVSLFNGGLFNAKATFHEEQYWYYLTHGWEDKEVHNFYKGIRRKGSVIV